MTRTTEALLGDIASFIRGITFKPEDVVPLQAHTSVACMRTKNVQAELDLGDVWGIPAPLVKRKEQFLQAGDLLVSTANSWNLVGKCSWVPELPWPATFGGFVSVLRPDRGRVDPRYLYRWFASDRVQATVRSFGQQTTNISNLNVDRCLRLQIALPPIEQQQRIAAILDKADELRARRRAVLAQLDALAQSVFLDMFGDPVINPKGWPARSLSELRVEFRYGTSNKAATSGRPTLRIPNVAGGVIDLGELKYVPVSNADYERMRLNDGDILFVRTNGNPDFVGRCALVSHEALSDSDLDPSEFIFASYLIRARLADDAIAPAYLREYLLGAEGRRQLRSRSKTSAGQYNINAEGLSTVSVLMPPRSLQTEFIRRLQAVELLKSDHRGSLKSLDALFASLQHRAFHGEL